MAGVDGILIQRALFREAHVAENLYGKLEAAITSLMGGLDQQPDEIGCS